MKILENGTIAPSAPPVQDNRLDVSVVIVSWNTRDLLDRCLLDVRKALGGLQVEVIVVDNGSTDGTPEWVQSRFPEVHLISNAENTGFSRANNQALEVSRGRYILLLNSDAFLEPESLTRMVALMDEYPDTGAAGCCLLNEDGSLQRSAFGFATLATELWQALFLDRLFPHSKVFGAYRMSYWGMDDLREVDSVMGACMILRAEAIHKVGGLDERYFMYSEEMDLCYRLRQAGWKVRYFPSPRAVHIWGGSSRRVPQQTFLRLFRSRVMFFRKHYGRLNAVAYQLLLFFSSLVRTVMGRLVLLIRKSESLQEVTNNYFALLREVLKY